MPTLHWIGKDKVINHHRDVPYKVLEHQYGFDAAKGKLSEAGAATGSGNMIIQGDNLEALKSLLPQYEGKVKCIYIDPPYNTGNEGWVYNDNVNDPRIKKWLGDVVGKEGEDLSRHDKWLCMMYPRLVLLFKLLSKDGVIFMSIGDDENATLRLMCDEIFGRRNFLAALIWNSEGNTDNQLEIKINHEYVLVYAQNINNKASAIGDVIDPNTREDSNLWKGLADNNINKNNPRNPPVLVTLPAGFPSAEETLEYAGKKLDEAFFTEATSKRFITEELKRRYSIENLSGLPVKVDDMSVAGHKLVKDCRIFGGLANHSKLKEFIAGGFKPIKDGDDTIAFYLNKNAAVRYHKVKATASNILSVLRGFGTTERMKTELKRSADIRFDYPKPVDLVQYLLSIGAEDKSSIVLDSFAGSGTTGHAVLNLNAKDGGKRKFILIEMMDYAETMTAQRLKRVISGYGSEERKASSTGGAFDYYTLGEPLFDAQHNLNEAVGTEKIREYIWYSETRSTLQATAQEANGNMPGGNNPHANPYFLGTHEATAYYFVYEKDDLTTLDHELLATLPTKGERTLIYADNCLLPKKFMEQHGIVFKKIPRDITRF